MGFYAGVILNVFGIVKVVGTDYVPRFRSKLFKIFI